MQQSLDSTYLYNYSTTLYIAHFQKTSITSLSVDDFTTDEQKWLDGQTIIPPSDRTATIRDRTATRTCTRSPANVNTTREKVFKNTNLDKAAFLLRPVRSYHVLTARQPRPLHAYGVSFEIYGLGNGDHGRSRGALTTIMGFLPRVFYVYRECTATSWRFYHVLTATIVV